MDEQEQNQILERFQQTLQRLGDSIQKVRASKEYKAWEESMRNMAAHIRASASDFNPESAFVVEKACLQEDIKKHRETDNEDGLRLCRAKLFECACGLSFLQNVVLEPGKYRAILDDCELGAPLVIPRYDSYIHAWLSLYKSLTDLYEAMPASIYDYSPYYKARLYNLRRGLRGYRRMQKMILAR